MKRVILIFSSLLFTLSVLAYPLFTGSAVTITVNGNKNLQISVDGRDYNLYGNVVLGNKTTISLTNLQAGQHTFQAIRNDQNTNRSEKISTTFNLRNGFDMLININGNGSIELIETRRIGASDNQTPMSNGNFSTLLQNVKNSRSMYARKATITNAFQNTSNYFTTNQVMQLLQQINAENARLDLAKLSYGNITDRGNFDNIYSLLNSQASRNDLGSYVANYSEEGNSNTAMSDANFATLYQSIRQQWPVSAQMTSLNNTFANANSFFSTSQAKQLIQIVSGDNNRLQLAKISYRSITDPANFSQVFDLLSSQESKNDLTSYINNYSGYNTNLPMGDANFTRLYQTIQQQWPVSMQMSSLTNAFNTNNFFTTYQTSQLIQLISSEDNRLQLAKLSYHTVTDRNNFNQLYDLLSSQSSKNELANFINNYSGNNSNVSMTEANYSTLYQTIQRQFLPNEKMTSLTNTFNAAGNYFTVAQAKGLIQLISFENNKLQLAKLSYRTITDRTNFNQVYDIFSSQTSRDELDAYVRAYKE
jgi:hypothetical protein